MRSTTAAQACRSSWYAHLTNQNYVYILLYMITQYDHLLGQASGLRLRASQCPILVVVYLAGPQTINVLAEQLALDRTTLTRNLRPLVQDGLLTITAGHDQRTRVLTLTPQGEEALLRILPLWEEAQAYMVAGIGHAQVATLLAQLSDAAALAHHT